LLVLRDTVIGLFVAGALRPEQSQQHQALASEPDKPDEALLLALAWLSCSVSFSMPLLLYCVPEGSRVEIHVHIKRSLNSAL
jgi:hypothetical protein